MERDFAGELETSADYADIFELVKDGVEKTLSKSRAGLMLGIGNFGGGPGQYLGGYFTLDSNMIVMNAFPIEVLRKKDPRLLKPYVFHVLLHEYIHSLGWHDEKQTRHLTREVSQKLFGTDHPTSQMARDIQPFLPLFYYPNIGYAPKGEPKIFILSGFDKGHLTYVS